MKTEESTEFLKYDFTEAEIKEMSGKLARKIQEHEMATLRKKEMAKAVDSDIAAIDSIIKSLAQKVNNGYEYKDVKCRILSDYENKVKKYERLDTGETFREVQMTEEDLQLSLDGIVNPEFEIEKEVA